MKTFVEQAQFYAANHKNQTTQYTHAVGIPILFFSWMILLGFVHLLIPGVFVTNFAWIATLALLIYYFSLNWLLALAVTPIMLILLWISFFFSQPGPTKAGVWVFLITLIIGLGLQFYGYYIEKKKPTFLTNSLQLLIAPLFLMAELFFRAGYLQALKTKIHG